MEVELVGREAMLDQIVRNCRAGVGSVLAGPAGVGKSRLLREVLGDRTLSGWAVERLVATESTSAIPFGVLIPLIPRGAGEDRSQIFAVVREALLARAEGRKLLLAIDDAHQLDECSTACIVDLVHRGDAVAVATIRTDDDVPPAWTSLWASGAVERVSVDPLSDEATAELAAGLLGGPLDDVLAADLLTATRGNPLLTRELVLDALAHATIVEDDGRWIRQSELRPGTRLQELVAARVGRLEDGERRLLELLAVGEPVATSSLTPDEGPLVDALEQRGLVRVEPVDGGHAARSDHPLVGETIRTSLATRRRLEIVRELADRLSDVEARGSGDALRAARWWLESGEAPPASVAIPAMQEALTTLDLDFAAELAEEALATGESWEALIALGEARRLQGRPHDAEDALARAALVAPDEATLTHVTRLRSFVIIHQLERPGEGIELLESVAGRLTDRSLALELQQSANYFSGTAGRYPDVVRATRDILAHHEIDEETRWSARMNLGYAQVMLGWTDGVDALLIGCLDDAPGRGEPLETTDLLWTLRAGVFAERGDLVAGARLATESIDHRRAAGQPWGTSAAILSQVLLFRADPAVFAMLDDTRRELSDFDPFGVLPIALGVAACALAPAGRVDEAAAALAVVPDDKESGPRSAPFVGRGHAAVLAASGELERAAKAAEAAGMDALDTTHVAFGVIALHDAARYGWADRVADVMADATLDPSARLLRTMVADAVARRDGDVDAVVAAADDFVGMGAPALAADALAHAATLVPDDDIVGRRLAARATLLAHPLTTVVFRLADGVEQPLSDRELDVVHHAVAGLSNRDIAETLFLAVRTVENHLHQAYRKLDVASRQELAQVTGPVLRVD